MAMAQGHAGKEEGTIMKKLLIAAAIALAPTAGLVTPTAHADAVCQSSPVKVVALGPTSCPFALDVANKMMSGAGTTFSVNSPVTGESYTMHCMVEAHGSTTCRDANGGTAAVQIF
jgi:hypothetical protein